MKKQYTIRVDEDWLNQQRAKWPELSHLSLSDYIVYRLNLEPLMRPTGTVIELPQETQSDAINDQPAATQKYLDDIL